MKTGKELTLEYMENDVRILEHCFNLFVKLNIDIYKLNSLHYISLPGFSFDCLLILSDVELETIQDERMLKDFIKAMRGGICGVMGNRHIIDGRASGLGPPAWTKSYSRSQGHSQS